MDQLKGRRNDIKPRIILHGGAGNITRENIPPPKLAAVRSALLSILESSNALLSQPGARALDVVVHAVSLMEDNPLFNCGKGAVFTRAGTNELEASVMVSEGYRKRGVGCMMVKRVRNPIKLVREMLVRGEQSDGGGAGAHVQLSGEELEKLALGWGLEMVDPNYFWTKERWDQHRRGLEKERLLKDRGEFAKDDNSEKARSNGDPSWDPLEYFPQGTVGAVVLDSFGTIAVGTSTGGLTNKLPGRIGDTPTLGAGFWAENWVETIAKDQDIPISSLDSFINNFSRGHLSSALQDCLSGLAAHQSHEKEAPHVVRHAVGLSGTGNGDSFLRLAAARTTTAMSRYSTPNRSLAQCVSQMAGPGGDLQLSAGDRWGDSGEGEGGFIAIELVGTDSQVSFDYNRGMFRAYIDDNGASVFGAFRDDDSCA